MAALLRRVVVVEFKRLDLRRRPFFSYYGGGNWRQFPGFWRQLFRGQHMQVGDEILGEMFRQLYLQATWNVLDNIFLTKS